MPRPAFREAFDERVWAVVRRVPRGRVASYKQVAALAGSPLAARIVSGALRRGAGVPWWRVLGADGSIRIMSPEWRVEQVERLRGEGVEVDDAGVVDMERHAWRPKARAGPSGRRPRGGAGPRA